MIRTYRFPTHLLNINRREALAYLRIREADAETNALLTATVREAKALADCRCRVGIFDTDFADAVSPVLRTRLAGYDRFVLFCATLGHELDRCISRYTVVSPAKAAMLDATGGALVEALCDKLTAELKKEMPSVFFDNRFSPGYGDFPLSAQRHIFDILELSRIGVGLNDSLLLSPSKTVTAVLGLKNSSL